MTVPAAPVARSNPVMAVDLPAQNATVPYMFAIAGWAADLGAAQGTGVDTLHVWAYPNPGSGAPPVFVGVAPYGFARPDVAAAFGRPQLANAGFAMTVSSLGPGVYDLVVFAHSVVTASFACATSVRVTVR